MSEIVINVQNVTKAYHIYKTPHDRLKQIFFGWRKSYFRDFLAMKNVSFTVEKGQSVGVIGRNGAGKSTLLQLLTGTLTPSSGKISVNGKVAAVLELGSGFNPEFSGRENIYLYASLFELPKTVIDERFNQILEFADLLDFIDQPVKTYSSGMQARLAFSVIAHVDADILIIDEALSVGDAFFTQKCMRFLRKFQETGTIFFVSHDLSAVTAFCDQAIWLEKGQIRSIGPAKEICESYFAEIYVQQSHVSKSKIFVKNNINLKKSKVKIKQLNVTNTQNLTTTPEDLTFRGLQKIESFGFNMDSSSFGTGDAEITSVEFFDASGNVLSVCEGGFEVLVKVNAQAVKDIMRPIIGFIIKDRLGQPLLGGNTFHAYKNSPVHVNAGDPFTAEFYFSLPILAIGDYSIVAAVADGTIEDHVQLHWLHDAVLFQVVASSIEGVIVGATLDNILLKTEPHIRKNKENFYP
jgi:lipopolysaccharide transport system ATP-binding protein